MAAYKRAEDGAAKHGRASQRVSSRRSRRAGKRVQKRRARAERRQQKESADWYKWVFDVMFRTPRNCFPSDPCHTAIPREGVSDPANNNNVNYAPRVAPDLDEHAYSPTTCHDTESELSDEIEYKVPLPDTFEPVVAIPPKIEIPCVKEEYPEQSVDPPRHACGQGLFYIPMRDETTHELSIATSSPMVDELLNSCTEGILEFVPPISTVVISEIFDN